MRRAPAVFAVMLATCLALVAAPAFAGDQTGEETNLAPEGQPFQANLDGQGMLWVTHQSPAELWRFDTGTGALEVYSVGGQPSDARGDGAGKVWWGDLGSDRLNRLDTGNNQRTSWQVTGSGGLYTTAIDSQGVVWASDYWLSYLYSLNPNTNNLCKYLIPDGGVGTYVTTDGASVWLGDSYNLRIVQFDASKNTWYWWPLRSSANPLGVAVDASHNVWWSDAGLDYLGRLTPGQDNYTEFDLPQSLYPELLSIDGNLIWLTMLDPSGPSAFGHFSTGATGGTGRTSKRGSRPVTPDCAPVTPSPATTVTSSAPTPAWVAQTYTALYTQGDWQTFRMPVDAAPFGIAAGGDVWLVDQGRNKLARVILGLAAPRVRIRIPSGTDDVELSWDAVTGATGYRVWFASDPYFTPDSTPDQDSAALSFSQPDVAFDVQHNYFYVVRARDANGVSANGNRTGKFTFSLTKGG